MKKWIKELFPYIIILIIVIFIKSFVVTPIRVNGPSMNDTLHDGDIMILNKISKQFRPLSRFDIVVVKTKIKNEEKFIIKRIIGLPKEKIAYQDNILYVNDKKIDEPYNREITKNFDMNIFENNIIPDDHYIVLGDNRIDSMDSRVIGFISSKEIIGTTSFTVFPFSRFGFKK